MATIYQVAERAGVSKSTVSRVINHTPGVAEPLRQAVLAAMKDLDYHPSSRRPGRKPKSRQGFRTGSVLLMYSGADAVDIHGAPVLPSLIHSAEAALAEAGMSLVISAFHQGKPLPPALAGDQVDGVLLLGSTRDMTSSMHRRLRDIPSIVLMRSNQDVPGAFDRVLYDNQAVGTIAANYLLDEKHRDVVLFNHDPGHPAFAIRQKNFIQTMKEADARVLEVVADVTKSDPRRVAQTLVEQIKRAKPSVTAIYALSDIILPQVYSALQGAGLQPQTDLSIVSCDNEESILSRLHPRPASIDIRADLIGRLAIRQLQWRLANPDEHGAVTVSIEPELVRP